MSHNLNYTKHFVYFIICLIVFNSCKDDNFEQAISYQAFSDSEFSTNSFGSIVNANFYGKIVNKTGNALSDVQIKIGNKQTTTDVNGVFTLNNVDVFEKYAYVEALKEGYIHGSRAIIPLRDASNDIQITLLEENIINTINSGEITTVDIPNGAKVEFQGDFIDQNNLVYSGQVNVSMHYLEPNTREIFNQMPGMLFGRRENGEPNSMETYGMIAINLTSPSGEKLNIDPNKPATLYFPISSSTPNAPNEIPLWYFDEENGFWKEQGVASKIGSEYIGQVSHFSWWNCDLPLDYVNVCINFASTSSRLSDFYIEIIRDETNQLIFSGYTNNTGEECGLFPANETVTINVIDQNCSNSVVYSETFGPFNSDTNINFNVPNNSLDIFGSANLLGNIYDCEGDPLNNGYLYILNNITYEATIVNITEGELNYNFSYCLSYPDNYSFSIYDIDSGLNSGLNALDLTESTIDLSSISICTDYINCYPDPNSDYLVTSSYNNFTNNQEIETIIQLSSNTFKTMTTGGWAIDMYSSDQGYTFTIDECGQIIVPLQGLFQGVYPNDVIGVDNGSGYHGTIFPNGDIEILYTIRLGNEDVSFVNYYKRQ